VHQVVTFGAGHLYMSQSDKGGLVMITFIRQLKVDLISSRPPERTL
jgi:hypothetical protein